MNPICKSTGTSFFFLNIFSIRVIFFSHSLSPQIKEQKKLVKKKPAREDIQQYLNREEVSHHLHNIQYLA